MQDLCGADRLAVPHCAALAGSCVASGGRSVRFWKLSMIQIKEIRVILCIADRVELAHRRRGRGQTGRPMRKLNIH